MLSFWQKVCYNMTNQNAPGAGAKRRRMTMDIKALAEKYESYVIEQRRWFHAHPELSWEEYKTTDAIAAQAPSLVGSSTSAASSGSAG